MLKKEVFDIFFREKPAMMLIHLNNAKDTTYASSLAKQVDCTYSHVVKILQKMEDLGLVVFEKQGRLKLLKLTKKGKDIAEAMDTARSLLVS
jgi:DNA-binding MarR family transcriptional regulator